MAKGTLTSEFQDQAQVFNESSADVDFRIESNGQANMFFVDGGNDKIGIGTSTPVTDLTIDGTLTLKEQAEADGNTAAYGQLWVNTATPCELYFTTDADNDIALTSGTAVAGGFDADAAQTFNDSGSDVDFRVESNNQANMFFVDGGTDKVGIGTNAVAAGQGTLTVYGRMQVTRGSAFQTLTTSAWAME